MVNVAANHAVDLVAAGVFHVIVTSVDDPTKGARAIVTVTKPAVNAIHVVVAPQVGAPAHTGDNAIATSPATYVSPTTYAVGSRAGMSPYDPNRGAAALPVPPGMVLVPFQGSVIPVPAPTAPW